MENLKISVAQFENHNGNKEYNLKVIREMAMEAAAGGSRAIAFHECSISGYTFARDLSAEEILEVAEPVPGGTSIRQLVEMADTYDITILAGLFERDNNKNLYNTYVAVNKTGLMAKHRKLHPFIHPDLKPGNQYTLFDLNEWKCGILTCYDNNIIENVRATALLGAQIIFMPHVTMGTPAFHPGAGFFEPELWKNKEIDPISIRREFDGPKGRTWLMKWLPSRAYDNGIYVVFSNPIGMDHHQLKNGCSMIIDPYGDILSECRQLGNEFISAICSPDKLTKSGGYRYRKARRPDLYTQILAGEHKPEHKVVWLDPSDELIL